MSVDLSKAKPGDIVVLRDGTEAEIKSLHHVYRRDMGVYSVTFTSSVAGTLTGSGRCHQWYWHLNGKKSVFSEEEGNHIVAVRLKEESRSREEASGPSPRLQTEGVEVKPGYWKTRDGKTAYVIGRRVILSSVNWPWLGEVASPDGDNTQSWTDKGYAGPDTHKGPQDLVEFIGENLPKPKKKVTHTLWVNLYDDGTYCVHTSERQATTSANKGHVECREITWTVGVEE